MNCPLMDLFPDSSDFINEIKDSLERRDVQRALLLFNNNKNYENIKNNCWELFPVVTSYLTFECENNNINLFRCCEELVNKIANISNPEETLLQFIDEIEECEGDTKFFTLLHPMLKVLQRIPRNRIASVSWCLNAIEVYLNKIDIAEGEGNENYVLRTEIIYYEVLKMYDLLIQYYSNGIELNEEYRSVFLKYLVNLLGKPLGFLNLEYTERKTKIRIIVEGIIARIIFLKRDPFYFIDVPETSAPLQFSYGIFLYLIFHEKINYEDIPKIHNNSYIFYSSLPYLLEILKTDRNFMTKKGLDTLTAIQYTEMEISHHYLQLEVNKKFCEILEDILVLNEHKMLRNQALNIFQSYLKSFSARGKYLLLFNLLPNVKHSGFASFIITTYKNILVNLQKNQSKDVNEFSSRKLYNFLNECCHMSKGDTYNIMNISEKIMAVLNLMRFVALQENLENRGNFRRVAANWRHLYLDNLTKLIDKSKQDFKKKKFEIELEKDPNLETNLMIGGHDEILEITNSEKIENIELAITGFEMIESLLSRLIEILKLKECY